MKRPWVVAAAVLALAAIPPAIAVAQAAASQPSGAATPAGQQQTTQADAPVAAPSPCSRTLLLDFDPNKGEFFGHDVPIWSIGDGSAVVFQSGMTIDADGAPNAYSPDNTGLDDLSNAGEPGHWDGIVADRGGEPYVQGADDPYPGFYVSQTALADWSKARTDPARYIDASKIPYIVLPGELSRQVGARLGDFALVVNRRNGAIAGAIFADIGTLGEGSIALADKLDIFSDARRGGTRGGVVYLVYPGSGNRQPRSLDDINSETAKLFQDWGGIDKLNSCTVEQSQPPGQIAQRNFH